MTLLTLELSTELYERLRQEAEVMDDSIQNVAQDLLSARLSSLPVSQPISEREKVREALYAAGLLAELSPVEKERAARSTMTLEEVQAALDNSGGKPLSELILEMRGPKD